MNVVALARNRVFRTRQRKSSHQMHRHAQIGYGHSDVTTHTNHVALHVILQVLSPVSLTELALGVEVTHALI